MRRDKLIRTLLKRKTRNVKAQKRWQCPKDLYEWILKNEQVLGYLYDIDLLPEQIHTKNQVCALRGFYYGWKAKEASK